jgi:hypothetical protein
VRCALYDWTVALYRLQRVRAASVGPRYNTRAATLLDIDDPWTTYFTAIAGASGAIFALLFVGMQVRLDVWRGNLLRIYAVALALFELAVPLIIILIVLMPQDTWQTGARIVGPTGVCTAIGHVLMHLRVRRAVAFDHQRRAPITRLDSVRVWLGSAGSVQLFGLAATNFQRYRRQYSPLHHG